MEKLVDLIAKEWGHIHKCQSKYVCGQCQVQVYCGKDCQKAHWQIHQLECIGVKMGIKRERSNGDEEDIEDDTQLKKLREEIILDNLNTNSRDVDNLISLFLNLDDIKNLRLVSRDRNQQFFWRMQQVNRFSYRIKDPTLLKTVPWLQQITHLIFDSNTPLNNVQWPRQLTHLTFGYDFDQPTVENLPPTLTHLTFGYNFNQPVEKLPRTLTQLTFGWRFNQPVKNWPPTLTHLNFNSYDFNQKIKVKNLPRTLTHLVLSYKFNQPINDNDLPSTLTHLTFDDYFNQPVENLPQTLTHLTFGYDFNQPVENLPPNLTYLRIRQHQRQLFPNARKEIIKFH